MVRTCQDCPRSLDCDRRIIRCRFCQAAYERGKSQRQRRRQSSGAQAESALAIEAMFAKIEAEKRARRWKAV